uniref:30S ribosomal protein S3 n=1 Tax=Nephromyces sp. ex Molgula occidentalis TaxID=2544991 RepID=A0A5C1H7S9_9APIC|nr:30S ribosomal protein S3 [Nephromyces sp. ex Molgula occidentalis]
MSRKISPFIFRTKFYSNYNNISKTPFNFKRTLNWDIYFFLNKFKDKFFIFNIKFICFEFNICKIFLNICFLNKFKFYLTQYFLLLTILDKLKFKFNKKYNNKYNIFYELFYYKFKFDSISYILFYIKTLIKKNISIRSILKLVSKNLLINNYKFNLKIYGFKFKISGIINNSTKSKIEIFNYGSLPLQTISNNIKYKLGNVKTKFGILGIKIWIFYN